jgi:nitrogen fixation-related uncharacterized protein
VDVVIVLVFVSLVLVTAAVVMFIMRVKGGDFEHGDRLALLPLEDEHESAARRSEEDGGDGGSVSGGNGERAAAR